jgi:hypothetical protein
MTKHEKINLKDRINAYVEKKKLIKISIYLTDRYV